ncbi:MAG: biotin transporter BioY [Firmicutes bacterium]|nr:biotin transporter BioY [Bacillota bacterium]
MKTQKLTVKDLALCALFAAVTAICAWISLPVLQIAFTMQTFAIFLVLFTLGGRRGTISILVYLLLGAVNLPVFSGFKGGMSAILGITGGYIWGFLLSGLAYWLITAKLGEKFAIPAAAVGLVVCYACGTAWFVCISGTYTWWSALSICVLPYIIPDCVKIALAWVLSRRLARFAN